jgi:hypothetical protein
MWFPSWPRSLDGRPAIERLHPSRSPRRRPRFRPGTEVLDARCLLSTLTVTSNLDSGGSVRRGAGDGTLRGEIAAAQSGDTIVFAPSLDGQTIKLGSARTNGGVGVQWSQLEINKNLTIQGPGAGLLAINGGIIYGSRVFQVDAGATVTISGLTIEGGHATTVYSTNSANTPVFYDGCGGGILDLGTLSLYDCNVIANHTIPTAGTGTGGIGWKGGGIGNLGRMTVSGCIVTGNSSYSWAGGIYNDGTMTLSGSTVSGNTAASGGGLFNDAPGKLTILSSVVQTNSAQDGADICSLGSLTISKDSRVGKISHSV